MSKNFTAYLLGDIGNIITGKTPPTNNPNNYGNDYMFIGPTDLHKHFIINKSEKMISKQGLESIKGSILNDLSILVGCIGWDMGNVGLVKEKCATNQQINAITNIKDVFNPYYIYYWLTGKKEFLFKQASVTRTPILRKSDFSKISINIPKKTIQDRVALFLFSLDSKIELNNRINAELESLAKTIYDYWFVQFDFPNADGKPYKSSGGEMVYVEELKREIPAGWKVDSLWKIANYFNGLPMQNNRPIDDNYLRVIKIREMNEGFSENTEFAKADIPKEAIVEDGDILFSWSATLDVKMWTQGKGALNQHIFKVTSNKFPKTFYYYELKNYLNHFKMMAERRKTTMGHITQEHLKQSRIVIPPNELVNQAHTMLTPMFEKRILLDKENQQLTQLRDWLLPMLMNGQVSIK
jgi:type I restriction enzyme S subunit